MAGRRRYGAGRVPRPLHRREHSVGYPHRGADPTADESTENLGRLSAALKELDARIRTGADPGGLPFDHDAKSLRRADMWKLICRYGEFDISFRPAGFDTGYAELIQRAHRMQLDGVEITIADLDDVIRSKERAGRPKGFDRPVRLRMTATP